MTPREGFIYSTPGAVLALNGNLVVYIENPAGNGRTLVIEKYRIPNQASGYIEANFFSQYTRGSTGLTQVTPTPFRSGSTDVATALVYTSGVSPSNLGNPTYLPLKPTDANEIISAPLQLSPGTGLAIVITATVAAKVSFQVYTREVINP